MKKIIPFLWFNDQAEEAMELYTTVFKDSKIGNVSRYPKGSPGPEGQVMTASFEINGQEFNVLNGGPQFKFTEAISFSCALQRSGRGRLLLECIDSKGWIGKSVWLAKR